METETSTSHTNNSDTLMSYYPAPSQFNLQQMQSTNVVDNQPSRAVRQPRPNNYYMLAQIARLFCLILGYVALKHSGNVDRYYASGQYEAAVAASSNAKKYSILSIIVGTVIGVPVIAAVISIGVILTMHNS